MRRSVARHGTANEYKNHGCRCEACKRAVAEYAKNRRAATCRDCGTTIWKQGQRPTTGLCVKCLGLARRVAEHATPGAYKRGCRCDVCRADQAARRRRTRAAQRAAA